MSELNGLLLVDKPKGWTSFDVVAKVRSIITRHYKESPELFACEQCAEEARSAMQAADGEAMASTEPSDNTLTQEVTLKKQIYSAPKGHRHKVRVGHSGTLDPMATGLLVLAIGKATKRIDSLMKLDKIYEAEITLGKTSTTDDQEGKLTDVNSAEPSLSEIEAVLNKFIGQIEQTPPIFSAIKIDGQRAYKAARAGKTPKMKPRKVTIKSISDVRYEYPKLSFITDVSSGTYIRSLTRDIGADLGTGSYLSELRRETVGEFSVQGAIKTEELNIEVIQKAIKSLA